MIGSNVTQPDPKQQTEDDKEQPKRSAPKAPQQPPDDKRFKARGGVEKKKG